MFIDSNRKFAASVEMEGYRIDEQCKDWCRKLLQGELTMEEYIVLVKQSAGVTASTGIQH